MKIGLLGLFGTGNSGNDGSLEAMIDYLRENAGDADLVCFCPNPSAVERMFRIRAIATGYDTAPVGLLARLNRAFGDLPRRCLTIWHPFRQTAGLEVLIVPGTGFLDDFSSGPFGWPFVIFRWCLAAWISGARIALVSIGAGPIENRLSRWFLMKVAQMAHYRSYRDYVSREFMTGLGLDTSRDEVFPDLAFKLPNPSTASLPAHEGVTVGVGVMAYSGWRGVGQEGDAIYERYIKELACFVRQLLERDYRIRLLTGDAGDKDAVRKLVHELGKTGHYPSENGRIVASTQSTLHELMEEIAETDLVVCTRFHNAVCAVKLARPTLSLSYSAKNDALLADVGLEDFHQHVETFRTDILMRNVEKALASRERLAASMKARTDFYSKRLAEQDALLGEKILRSRRDGPLAELERASQL